MNHTVATKIEELLKEASAEGGYEFTLRVTGPSLPGGLEISIDGGEYRRCRRERGAWRFRWDGALPANAPVVAVIRATAEPTPFD